MRKSVYHFSLFTSSELQEQLDAQEEDLARARKQSSEYEKMKKKLKEEKDKRKKLEEEHEDELEELRTKLLSYDKQSDATQFSAQLMDRVRWNVTHPSLLSLCTS